MVISGERENGDFKPKRDVHVNSWWFFIVNTSSIQKRMKAKKRCKKKSKKRMIVVKCELVFVTKLRIETTSADIKHEMWFLSKIGPFVLYLVGISVNKNIFCYLVDIGK